MIRKILIILLIFTFISCNQSNNEEVVSGELVTNIRSFINFETASSAEIRQYIKTIDSIANVNNETEIKQSSKFYHNLVKHKLTRVPSIYLKLQNDSIIQIFVDKNQYKKLRKYDFLGSDLKNKVTVKLKYKRVDDFILLTDSIIEIHVKKIRN